MIAPLLAALILTQTPPSESELNGALNSAQIAAAAAVAGTRTISPIATALACIRFAGGGAAPPGAITISFGVAVLSPEFEQAIGLGLPPAVPDWAAARDAYAYVEVQAVPSALRDPILFPLHIDLLTEEAFVEAVPSNPLCEVLLLRADNPSAPFRCACSTGAACNLVPSLGGGPAPIQETLPPDSWVGGGCAPKPCFGRYDGPFDLTWPAACPL